MGKQEEKQQKKRAKRHILKPRYGGVPSLSLAWFVYVFLRCWFWRYPLKIDRTELLGLKPPFIIIGNHPSNLDAFLVGRSIHPRYTNYLASQFFYRFPIMRFLLRKIGAIPKAHSPKDTQALRLMMRVLSEGRILVVFPEGRRSMDGRGSRFSPAFSKFVKRSKVPVVSAKIQGSWLTWPRWAEHASVGPLSVTFKRLLEPDQLERLSVEEIHTAMLDALRFDDVLDNEIRQDSYQGKERALGMEYLLHLCPDCGQTGVMRGSGQQVSCQSCGAAAELSPTGSLLRLAGKKDPWPSIPEWFDMQRAELANAMRDPAYQIEGKARISVARNPEKKMQLIGTGAFALTREGLHIDCPECEDTKALLFPMSLLDTLPVVLGKCIEICDGDGAYWQFAFDDPTLPVRFEQFSDITLYGEINPLSA